MQPGELVVEAARRGDRHTLSLAGELDLATAADLETAVAELCADGARELCLDLQRLAFVDSAGLRSILHVRSLCEGSGCTFAIENAAGAVLRVLEVTGLLRFCDAETAPQRSSRPGSSSTRERAASNGWEG